MEKFLLTINGDDFAKCVKVWPSKNIKLEFFNKAGTNMTKNDEKDAEDHESDDNDQEQKVPWTKVFVPLLSSLLNANMKDSQHKSFKNSESLSFYCASKTHCTKYYGISIFPL